MSGKPATKSPLWPVSPAPLQTLFQDLPGKAVRINIVTQRVNALPGRPEKI